MEHVHENHQVIDVVTLSFLACEPRRLTSSLRAAIGETIGETDRTWSTLPLNGRTLLAHTTLKGIPSTSSSVPALA